MGFLCEDEVLNQVVSQCSHALPTVKGQHKGLFNNLCFRDESHDIGLLHI